MAIMRIFTGKDGESHFEDVYPRFEPRGDQSETAELIPGSGIIIRRFDPKRMNPWHNAPGHYVVFTVSGAVDIEIGDGTVKRLGPGDILIAEDLTGRGHITREVGPPHARSFEAVAQVDGEEIGRGEGKSKKSAEQSAALAALTSMDND